MGDVSFLTGDSSNKPESVSEALYELENASILFKTAWLKTPPDFERAAKVSNKAMGYLDHVVNEILRARDTKLANKSYNGSGLKNQLNTNRGLIVRHVDELQQKAMINSGPGAGRLPFVGTPIKLEELLNKIKHRHHREANFRIENDRHIFVINVDKSNKKPDSIVEFDVLDLCEHGNRITPHL